MYSQRIIVRASNAGQFDHEGDSKWIKGKNNSTVYHGNVGINIDAPSEALAVAGNIKVTGTVLHPSDMRIKEDIEPMDTGSQLENVKNLKLYTYRLTEDWAATAGRENQVRCYFMCKQAPYCLVSVMMSVS